MFSYWHAIYKCLIYERSGGNIAYTLYIKKKILKIDILNELL